MKSHYTHIMINFGNSQGIPIRSDTFFLLLLHQNSMVFSPGGGFGNFDQRGGSL